MPPSNAGSATKMNTASATSLMTTSTMFSVALSRVPATSIPITANATSTAGRLMMPPPCGPDSSAAGSDDDRRCSSSPHRRLFKLFRSASVRCRALPAPRLALADVSFAVDIVTAGGESTLSFLVAADRAAHAKNSAGLFLFGVDLSDRSAAIGPGEWRVRWTAVRTTARRGEEEEPAAAVLMMDAKVPAARAAGAVAFGGRGEAGVAARLPAPGCGGAKLDAEVVVELAGEEMVVEKVRLGVMRECRYVCADEGLRYLQHFLL